MTAEEYTNKILNGDCLEVLKTLPDKICDCCVTSPPYYGLRDYGTGTWIGGDPNCPHRRTSKFSPNTATGHAQKELIGNVGDAIYKTVCPLCGAVREDKQIGLEETPELYVEKLVEVFREIKRVLKDDGTLWVNIGDSYWGSGSRGFDFTDKFSDASKIQQGSKGTTDLHNLPKLVGNKDGYKNKDLIGIPWMLAFALRNDGWYLRQDIIWHKPNPMPESVKDRCTKSHEYIFLLSKRPHYYFDYQAIQEDAVSIVNGNPRFGGNKYGDNDDSHFAIYSGNEYVPNGKRNKRDVWESDYNKSKFENEIQESEVRQGMNKQRGNKIIAIRKSLPTQERFVKFLKAKSTVDILSQQTSIKRTTIEHWFREDENGFSYPSIEDWNTIREILNDSSEEYSEIDNMMSCVTYETDAVDKNFDGKRNKRDVWRVSTKSVKEAHFATFPEELIEPCILGGSRKGGLVIDPFFGSGTTGRVCTKFGRNYIGIELNPQYIEIGERRNENVQMDLMSYLK